MKAKTKIIAIVPLVLSVLCIVAYSLQRLGTPDYIIGGLCGVFLDYAYCVYALVFVIGIILISVKVRQKKLPRSALTRFCIGMAVALCISLWFRG